MVHNKFLHVRRHQEMIKYGKTVKLFLIDGESELSQKEVEMIRKYESNNPKIGYNQWPKFKQ